MQTARKGPGRGRRGRRRRSAAHAIRRSHPPYSLWRRTTDFVWCWRRRGRHSADSVWGIDDQAHAFWLCVCVCVCRGSAAMLRSLCERPFARVCIRVGASIKLVHQSIRLHLHLHGRAGRTGDALRVQCDALRVQCDVRALARVVCAAWLGRRARAAAPAS